MSAAAVPFVTFWWAASRAAIPTGAGNGARRRWRSRSSRGHPHAGGEQTFTRIFPQPSPGS